MKPRALHPRGFSATTRWMPGLLVMLFAFAAEHGHAADDTELLREAIERWSHERDAWAFTQTVREFDGENEQHARIERYDPSHGEAERWTLVTIDGRPPTNEEVTEFQKRKGARRKNRKARTPSDYVDFPRVTVLRENPEWIQYAVPLREDVHRLIQVEHLTVLITVDRQRRAVQKLAITLGDPMKIAFGLAKVTDMNFDLRFELIDGSEEPAPENVHPVGAARATMHKFGDRAEFSWSDFTRVTRPETREADP